MCDKYDDHDKRDGDDHDHDEGDDHDDGDDHDHDEGRLWECIALITQRGLLPQDFAYRRVVLAFLIELFAFLIGFLAF